MRWLALALCVSLPARAADCPSVEINLIGDRWTEPLAQRLRAELEVEVRRVGLCDVGGARAVAQVVYLWADPGPVGLSVTFSRGETERILKRRFDPQGVPGDGLALALAAVGGELLAEVQQVLRPPPVPPPAEPVAAPTVAAPPVEVAVPAAAPPAQLRWLLSARGAGEAWSGRERFWGGDLALRFLSDRFEAELAVGGRGSIAQDTAQGRVRSGALIVGTTAAYALWRGETSQLGGEVGFWAGPVWNRGAPNPGWAATERVGWIAGGRAGVELAWIPGRVRWSARAGLDVPLHGVAVTDGLTTLEAVGGVGAYATLGGGWLW